MMQRSDGDYAVADWELRKGGAGRRASWLAKWPPLSRRPTTLLTVARLLRPPPPSICLLLQAQVQAEVG